MEAALDEESCPDREAWIDRLTDILDALVRDRREPLRGLGKRLGSWLQGEIGLLKHPESLPTPGALEALGEDAEAFTRAIRPRRVHLLRVMDRGSFDARLRSFVERRHLSREELFADLDRRMAFGLPDLSAATRSRLLDELPIERLSTYPDDLLFVVAGHFEDWNDRVRGLGGGMDASSPGDLRLDEFLNRITRIVRSRAYHRDSKDDVEDALQAVLAELIEQAHQGEILYTYEGRFDGWLIRAAVTKLRSFSRREDHESPPETVPGEAGRVLDSVERLRSFRDYFLLAESTFLNPQVRRIWKELLLQALEASDLSSATDLGLRIAESDEVLAAKLGLGVANLRTIRRRIRQRMGAIRFVREVVPGRAAVDLHGDVSMLEWVKERWGCESGAESTLRLLAALARASTDESTLGWALYARALIETRVGNPTWRATAEEMIRASGRPDETRMAEANNWHSETRRQQKLVALRRPEREIRFFLTPVWMLTVWFRADLDRVLAVLLPAATERTAITDAFRSLEEEMR